MAGPGNESKIGPQKISSIFFKLLLKLGPYYSGSSRYPLDSWPFGHVGLYGMNYLIF